MIRATAVPPVPDPAAAPAPGPAPGPATEPAPAPAAALAALVTPAGRRDPHPLYEAIRAWGNVVLVSGRLVAVAGYRECELVLRHPQLLVQDAASHAGRYPDWRSRSALRGFTHSMLYTNPPDHARLRRLVSGAFTGRRTAALRPVVQRMARRLLDRMADLGAGGAPVDFMAEFAFRLPVAVIGELLGVPEEDHAWFRAASADVTVALEGTTNVASLDRADAAMDELSAYFSRLAEYRRRHPAGDLISALVQVHDADGGRPGGCLSHAELVGNLVLLLVAGFDTTTNLLGQGLRLAFEHPDCLARLRTEPGFGPPFVEEALRFEPAIQVTTRWPAVDVELAGIPVPAGTKVLLLLAAGNRDPARFDRPHRFDPDRPDNRSLTFGTGIHRCIGASLARMEAQIALPGLLRRFPRLAVGGSISYRDRLVVPGPDRFPVTL